MANKEYHTDYSKYYKKPTDSVDLALEHIKRLKAGLRKEESTSLNKGENQSSKK